MSDYACNPEPPTLANVGRVLAERDHALSEITRLSLALADEMAYRGRAEAALVRAECPFGGGDHGPLIRQAKDKALREAARTLTEHAVERFDVHGPHDARGAALWDAAAHLDPHDVSGEPT